VIGVKDVVPFKSIQDVTRQEAEASGVFAKSSPQGTAASHVRPVTKDHPPQTFLTKQEEKYVSF
jgi:hypothetical protein